MSADTKPAKNHAAQTHIVERLKMRLRIRKWRLPMYTALLLGLFRPIEGEPAPQNPTGLHQSSETDFVSLTVTMNRKYQLGEPILVNFALKNDKSLPVEFNHDLDSNDVCLRLKSADSQPVPATDFGRRINGDPYQFTHNIQFSLAAGESRNWRYNLLDYFQVTKPGYYRLFAIKAVGPTVGNPNSGGSDEEINVGPIYFELTQAVASPKAEGK